MIIGNGVLNGWNLITSTGRSVVVSPGAGHVAFVSVVSEDNRSVGSLAANTRNYIYAATLLPL